MSSEWFPPPGVPTGCGDETCEALRRLEEIGEWRLCSRLQTVFVVIPRDWVMFSRGRCGSRIRYRMRKKMVTQSRPVGGPHGGKSHEDLGGRRCRAPFVELFPSTSVQLCTTSTVLSLMAIIVKTKRKLKRDHVSSVCPNNCPDLLCRIVHTGVLEFPSAFPKLQPSHFQPKSRADLVPKPKRAKSASVYLPVKQKNSNAT